MKVEEEYQCDQCCEVITEDQAEKDVFGSHLCEDCLESIVDM